MMYEKGEKKTNTNKRTKKGQGKKEAITKAIESLPRSRCLYAVVASFLPSPSVFSLSLSLRPLPRKT